MSAESFASKLDNKRYLHTINKIDKAARWGNRNQACCGAAEVGKQNQIKKSVSLGEESLHRHDWVSAEIAENFSQRQSESINL